MNVSRIRRSFAIGVCLGAALHFSLSAGSVCALTITDDFEGYTAGNPLPNTPVDGSPWTNTTGSTNATADVVDDASDFFGASNGNYLSTTDAGGDKVRVDLLNLDLVDLMTLQFDFYEPATGDGNSLTVKIINGGDVLDTRFDNGVGEARSSDGNAAFAYSENAAQTFLAVMNNGVSPQSYTNPSGGVASVAPGTTDYYLGPMGGALTLFADDLAFDGAFAGPPATAVIFQTSSGGSGQEIYIDNVTVTGVPEPTTVGLLSYAGLWLLRRRR